MVKHQESRLFMYMAFITAFCIFISMQLLKLARSVNCDGIQMEEEALTCAISLAFEKYRENNNYKDYVIR